VDERVGRALVELTRRSDARTTDPLTLLDQVPTDRLVDRACHHRVPGVVYRSLSELGMDGAEFAGLRAAYQMASLSHQRCLLELETMAEVLGKLEHPWLVVKGPVLAEIGYGDPGARLYEDLDVVVAATDLSSALTGIEAAGGRVADLNWPMMVELMRAEVPMVLPHGMLGDLHWHVLVTPSVRSRFAMSMDELFERRRTVRLGGTDVATLDTVDGILYLCLHGSLSGGDQLVWLKDLDQMIVSEASDWDELARRAVRYRVGLVAAIQLERARMVLGTPVPESLPAALAHNQVWWRWWRTRERKVGMARWGGGDHDDSRFVSATSDGSMTSAVQLARTVASDMVVHYLDRRKLDPRKPGRRSGSSGDGSPGSGSTGDVPERDVPELYRPAGEGDARAEYLELVEAGRWS
jgi:hypothetical protein